MVSDVDESGAGATSAARERLELIEALPLLDATLETDQLAAALIAAKAIPETEPRDAYTRMHGIGGETVNASTESTPSVG